MRQCPKRCNVARVAPYVMLHMLLSGTACDSSASRTRADASSEGARKGDAATVDGGDSGGARLDAARDAAAEDGGDARDAGGSATLPAIVREDYALFDELVVPPSGELSLQFEVPSDAVSFVLTADPLQTPRRIALLGLTGPDGRTLFDLTASQSAFDPAAVQNLSHYVPYVCMLPSSPELPLLPGRYSVRLLVDQAAPTDADASVHPSDQPISVDVVWKRAPSAPTEGSLPVTLWFVVGSSLDAASAKTDTSFQASLGTWRDIYAKVGLTLGPLSYRDLGGSGASPYSMVSDDAALAALLGELAAADDTDRSLSVVFVESLASGAGKTVTGKVSSLPGPPAHPAIARRGAVIVPIDKFPYTDAELGALLAHEAAHYLGLRHTTEFDGARFDPIADTPECRIDHASQTTPTGSPLLSPADCQNLDGTNLLFYTTALGAFPQQTLTRGQSFVLLRNPLVQ